MFTKHLFGLLLMLSIIAAPLDSSAQTQPALKPEFTFEETYASNLNALCAGGQAIGEGCDAIRARNLIDASAFPWRALVA